VDIQRLQSEKPQRLYSLDALRGFDMFWIMGLGSIIVNINKGSGSPFWSAFSNQFVHPVWNGFAFWDLIFPLFMFMSGVSTPYSVGRELEKGKSKGKLLVKVIKRGIILILLGIIYNNGLELRPISDIRFPSVLGKIGAAYMFANIIYLYANKKNQWVCFWGFLIGYWLLLKFTSAPGYLPGDLTEPGNFMSYLDRSILPGKLSRGIHDTVGLICTIPGISNVLLGIFAGRLLKNNQINPTGKAKWLAIAGIISIVLAMLWNLDFPFNKNLWSSSFVLLTGGLSLILLSLFYYVIDVLGYKRWTLFFRVIGMNSILIYMSPIFINWGYTANGLFKWLGQLVGEPYDKIVLALCAVFVQWLFLYFLYKKKVFLRI
jgi:predicted acyltransferase